MDRWDRTYVHSKTYWERRQELKEKYGVDAYVTSRRAYGMKIRQQTFANSIMPEIGKLDAYIDKLSKANRFAGVKGKLYDPVAGWNPGYRVLQSDLMSIIPTKPFEAIHNALDVKIGEPYPEPEKGSIGYMPFQWIQNGVRVIANPLGYELQRAKAIRSIYAEIMESLSTAKDDKEALGKFQKYSEYWNQWNFITKKQSIGYYDNPDDVIYKDRFQIFLEKFRKGEVASKDNNLEHAKKIDKIDWGKWGKRALMGLAIGLGSVVLSPVGMAVAAAAVHGVKKLIVRPIQDVLKYDRNANKDAEEVDENAWFGKRWFTKGMNAARKAKRFAQGLARLNRLKKFEAFGLKYGDVRNWMIDGGVLSLFKQGQIANTALSAIPLLDWLKDHYALDTAKDKDGDASSLHDLISYYFLQTNTHGYKWSMLKDDKYALAGFAQSFLEYFALKVIPLWNRVERFLGLDMTYRTENTDKALKTAIIKLHISLQGAAIVDFMRKYLRFPHMKVKLVDFPNAVGGQLTKLRMYRHKLGIPTPEQRQKILKSQQALWKKMGEMSDQELDKNLEYLRKLHGPVTMEAKATGSLTFKRQLEKFYAGFLKEKDERILRKRQ